MRVLFIGQAGTRVAWFRAVLPSLFLDGDWCTVSGDPPGLRLAASWVDHATQEPDMLSYDVVVVQQVRGLRWMELIKKLQRAGVRVLYETDDWLSGVRDVHDHEFKAQFTKEHDKEIRYCMRACDGMIVSTKFLRDKYRPKTDRPIYVCENGLDLGRYRLGRPDRGQVSGRETVTILWSGATGHQSAVLPWIGSVIRVMQRVPHTSFVTIGKNYADMIGESFKDRTLSIPFGPLETYPSAMTAGDVSIAPSGTTDWHRAKSQLRVMESMALGIPVVASEHYRETIDEYGGGYIVSGDPTSRLQELVEDDELRTRLGDEARVTAHTNFGMDRRVEAWKTALTEAVERPPVR